MVEWKTNININNQKKKNERKIITNPETTV